MYEVEAKNKDFKSRLNSTFDVLTNLEVTHKQKNVEYIEEKEFEEKLDDANVSNTELACTTKKDFDFKVPSLNLMKRPQVTLSQSDTNFKCRKVQPDFVVNPDKWKKYSLEDVADSQMSPSANYFAAINFLKQKEKTKNSTHEEFDKFEELADKTELLNDPSLFNKPIGGGVKKMNQQNKNFKIEKKLFENLNESKEIDGEDDGHVTQKLENNENQFQFSKKKPSRKNLRLKVEENENENDTLNSKHELINDSKIDVDKSEDEHQDIDVDIDDYLS